MADVNFRRILLVAAGGTMGTAARLGLGLAIPDTGGFPVAVLIANVVGALLIGAVGATVPSRQAIASTPVTFADPGPLAPSSLLLGSGER